MESERSAASLAMQSHHILFWSCRHWGSPLSPLLTIRTCHWISFKKTPISSYSLRPYLSAFPFLLCCFFFYGVFTLTSPATPTFVAFLEDGNPIVANFIYYFFYFSRRWSEKNLTWLRRCTWSENTPLFLLFLFFCSAALPPDFLSVDIIPDSAHANDMRREGARLWITHPPPLPSAPLLHLLLFPGWSRSGMVSWNTLRNHGHGVSLGKQRPGQQGFTQTLIILRALSGESPQLHTWLELLPLIVHCPFWLEWINLVCYVGLSFQF